MLKKALYEKNTPRLESVVTNNLPTFTKITIFKIKRFKRVFVVWIGKYTLNQFLLNVVALKRKIERVLVNRITTFCKICYNFDVKTILGGVTVIIKRTIKQT